MPSYITEPYLARHRRGELASLSTRARDTARTLVVAGQPVAYLRRAFDRVIAELERPTPEEPCQPESA